MNMKIPPQAMEKLKEFAVKAFQEVLHWSKKQVSQTWKDLTDVPEVSKNYSVSLLDKATLVSIIKENIVPNSNQACVIKQSDKQHNYLFVVYANNRVLLPKEQNLGICITSEALKREVETLFEASNVIIIE